MKCPECKNKLRVKYKSEKYISYEDCCNLIHIEKFLDNGTVYYIKQYRLKKIKEGKCPECNSKLKPREFLMFDATGYRCIKLKCQAVVIYRKSLDIYIIEKFVSISNKILFFKELLKDKISILRYRKSIKRSIKNWKKIFKIY